MCIHIVLVQRFRKLVISNAVISSKLRKLLGIHHRMSQKLDSQNRHIGLGYDVGCH